MACGKRPVVQGLATWFCCGSPWGPCAAAGTGACGTCNSGLHQCAWPNISDACYAFDDPPACGLSLPRYRCGSNLYVVNSCSGQCVQATIADCGPETHLFCNQPHCCGSVCGSNRIIDLTPSAFSAIADLAIGVLPCQVRR